MKLLIVIPALNEEESIASIIERCLAARAHIVNNTPVDEVEITVVSDGSTDRTVEIARGYADQINLIVFEKNRGYGAAITEGWTQSDADLLSFLDADGTCDPNHLVPLCNRLIEKRADVVLGCRMNAHSQMPPIRRVGNVIFATMLTLLSMKRVRDTASGMRVVRRSSLKKLFPLPQGLHFTPAMSARAILSRDLRIEEVDMPYHERAGESKLRPIRDGLRFTRVILETAMLYRPSRPLGIIACALFALTCAMMIYPASYYFQTGHMQEWMIYRFLVGELLSTVSILTWSVTYLGHKAVDISLSEKPDRHKYHGLWGRLYGASWFWAVPAAVTAIGGSFVLEAAGHYLATGTVTAHWARFVAMMFCLSVSAILVVTKVVDYCLNLLADRLSYLKSADAQPLKLVVPDQPPVAKRKAA